MVVRLAMPFGFLRPFRLESTFRPNRLFGINIPVKTNIPFEINISFGTKVSFTIKCLPRVWWPRDIVYTFYLPSSSGMNLPVRLINTNGGIYLVPLHFRTIHSWFSIWKELAHHVKGSLYIFISSQYGKKCPKISRPKLQILSTMKDPTFKGS